MRTRCNFYATRDIRKSLGLKVNAIQIQYPLWLSNVKYRNFRTFFLIFYLHDSLYIFNGIGVGWLQQRIYWEHAILSSHITQLPIRFKCFGTLSSYMIKPNNLWTEIFRFMLSSVHYKRFWSHNPSKKIIISFFISFPVLVAKLTFLITVVHLPWQIVNHVCIISPTFSLTDRLVTF